MSWMEINKVKRRPEKAEVCQVGGPVELSTGGQPVLDGVATPDFCESEARDLCHTFTGKVNFRKSCLAMLHIPQRGWVLHVERPRFHPQRLPVGLGKSPVWNPREPLPAVVGNTGLDGPMV